MQQLASTLVHPHCPVHTASGAPKRNQANEASQFELSVKKAGTSTSSAYAQPVSFGFESTGFGKVCLTPNKSKKQYTTSVQ